MLKKEQRIREESKDKEEKSIKKSWKNKEFRKYCIKEACTYVLIIVFTMIIFPNFVADGVIVEGSSMESTLHDRDRLVAEKISTNTGNIKRFDIVYFDPHNDEDEYWIKRVIGLPGETVQIIGEDIFINGEKLIEHYGKEPIEDAGLAADPYQLGDDEYFVMGDNRNGSWDSRYIGAIKKKDIDGRACFRWWPIEDFGSLK